MTKLFLTLAVLFLTVSVADAQSFYKKQHKFRRSYMAKAITGAVNRPALRAFNSNEANFTTSDGSIEDERPLSSKSLRRAQRRAERAARRQARELAREERRMHRAEERALGDHLIANRTETNAFYSR